MKLKLESNGVNLKLATTDGSKNIKFKTIVKAYELVTGDELEITENEPGSSEKPRERREINNYQEYYNIADKISKNKQIFFIGRALDYANSLEGSLKLKEISYINSVAYQAGELKHGTISLIEASTPVIAIATNKNLVDKTISNIKEVKARGAYVIYESFIDPEDKFYDEFIKITKIHPLLESILTIIPLQLLAYKVAKNNKCDIDKPRNLAKSVTVE